MSHSSDLLSPSMEVCWSARYDSYVRKTVGSTVRRKQNTAAFRPSLVVVPVKKHTRKCLNTT